MRTIPKYFSEKSYSLILKKIFSSPRRLLYSPALSQARKKHLLKLWRDERTLYILENCRDHDYLQDQEMEDLLRSLQVIKTIISKEEDMKIKIRIRTKDGVYTTEH